MVKIRDAILKDNDYFQEKTEKLSATPRGDHNQSTITMVAALANSGHPIVIIFIYFFVLNISSLWQVRSCILANKAGSHVKLQSCLNTSTLRDLLQGMYPCQYAFGCQTDKNE